MSGDGDRWSVEGTNLYLSRFPMSKDNTVLCGLTVPSVKMSNQSVTTIALLSLDDVEGQVVMMETDLNGSLCLRTTDTSEDLPSHLLRWVRVVNIGLPSVGN